jgi:hypothetical protein
MVEVSGWSLAVRSKGPLKRPRHIFRTLAAIIAVGLVGALVAIVAWGIVTDGQAVPVRFVNNTPIVVALPDCSTDIATIKAGQTVVLPVASDVAASARSTTRCAAWWSAASRCQRWSSPTW